MYCDVENTDWFTAEHDSHDYKWVSHINGQQTSVCIACAIEVLEDSSELMVRKKLILGQLLEILQCDRKHLVEVLLEDTRVAAHVSFVLLELTQEGEDSFAGLVIEVCHRLLMALENEEVLGCTIDNLANMALKLCNYKKCVTMLSLLGRLLHDVPLITSYILQNNGSLVDFVCAGIGYPDSTVQCCVCYVCIQLYSQADEHNSIPPEVSDDVISHVLQVLSTTGHGQELILNFLGLLKIMLESSTLADKYVNHGMTSLTSKNHMTNDSNKPTLAGAVKSVLLSRNDVIQLGGAQCIITLLRTVTDEKRNTYAGILLKYDIAEFLFEAMSTTNDLLIGCLFTCLLLLTETDTFFHKCHAVYGMESLIRSLELAQKNRNADLQIDGATLLRKIFANHGGNIRLFSSSVLVQQCLSFLTEAISHHQPTLSLTAADCLTELMRKGHMTSPPPYANIMSTMQILVTRFCEQPAMQCCPPQTGLTVTRSEVSMSREKIDRVSANQQQRSYNTQTWLFKLLASVEQVLSLCVEIGADPKQNEQSYAYVDSYAENSQSQYKDHSLLEQSQSYHTSVQDLIFYIVGVVNDTCLPAYSENLDYISDASVISCMYSCLDHMFIVSADQREEMATKLIRAGCVLKGLRAKSSFSDECVSQKVDKFTVSVLSILVEDNADDSISELTQTLREGCAQLHGDLRTVIYTGVHSSSEAQQQSVMCCSIFVLYHTVLLCPEEVSDIECYHAICDIINKVCDVTALKLLPKPTFKYLVYLHAWSLNNESNRISDKELGEKKLLQCIETCAAVHDWCSVSPYLLEWCFANENITDVCGSQVLELWQNEQDTGMEAKLRTFVSDNINAVKLLMLQVSDNIHMSQSNQAFSLLQHVLCESTWNNVGDEMKEFVTQHLPELTHRAFLHKTQQKDSEIVYLIRLLCEVKMRTVTEPLDNKDTKILMQVCKLLSSSCELSSEVKLVCWNLISIWLLKAKLHVDDRVCCMLLNYEQLSFHIENSLDFETVDVSIVLTLALLLEQSQHIDNQDNIENEKFKLTLPVDKLIRPLLFTNDEWTTVAVLLFWLAYLETFAMSESDPQAQSYMNVDLESSINHDGYGDVRNTTDAEEHSYKRRMEAASNEVIERSRSVLMINLQSSDRGIHLGNGDGVGQLHDTDIATMYLFLLQLVIKEHVLYTDVAVMCLDRLLSYTEVNTNLYNQLRNNKWSKVVLSSLFGNNSLKDITFTSPTMLNFIAVLLKHNIDYIKPYMKPMRRCLCQQVDDSLSELVCLSYKNCLQQLIRADHEKTEEKANMAFILSNLDKVDIQFNSVADYVRTNAYDQLIKCLLSNHEEIILNKANPQ